MSTDLREELATFERDLANIVARFLRLYERLESEVRPERQNAPKAPVMPAAPKTAANAQVLLPGYQ
jgi:hypothetical protein